VVGVELYTIASHILGGKINYGIEAKETIGY